MFGNTSPMTMVRTHLNSLALVKHRAFGVYLNIQQKRYGLLDMMTALQYSNSSIMRS